MNKTEFVAAVAEAAGASKKDAENIINETLAQIEKVLVAGDKVQFVGFGTFETRERGERTAKNPQTGAEITIPASKAPAFKAGKAESCTRGHYAYNGIRLAGGVEYAGWGNKQR